MTAPAFFASTLHCPVCQQANQCAVAAGQPPESCWCMQAVINPEVLAHIPAEQRNRACLCPACGQGLSPTSTPT